MTSSADQVISGWPLPLVIITIFLIKIFNFELPFFLEVILKTSLLFVPL